MSADNRPISVLPHSLAEDEEAVALDLLPRVRYRVRLEGDGAAVPSICFESGVLICPEEGSRNAVVINLSDRISYLRSGSRLATQLPRNPPKKNQSS